MAHHGNTVPVYGSDISSLLDKCSVLSELRPERSGAACPPASISTDLMQICITQSESPLTGISGLRHLNTTACSLQAPETETDDTALTRQHPDSVRLNGCHNSSSPSTVPFRHVLTPPTSLPLESWKEFTGSYGSEYHLESGSPAISEATMLRTDTVTETNWSLSARQEGPWTSHDRSVYDLPKRNTLYLYSPESLTGSGHLDSVVAALPNSQNSIAPIIALDSADENQSQYTRAAYHRQSCSCREDIGAMSEEPLPICSPTATLEQEPRLNHDLDSRARLSDHHEASTAAADGILRHMEHRRGTTEERDKTDEPYAQLIFRAFMSVPDHCMTLQEIYQWFREHTDKTRAGNKGWQNSIRHNLSMNMAFSKTDSKVGSAAESNSAQIRSGATEASKKSTEWYLEPWAIENGRVESTTRYRKNNSSRRAGVSSSPVTTKRTSYRHRRKVPENPTPNSSDRKRAHLTSINRSATSSPSPHRPHTIRNRVSGMQSSAAPSLAVPATFSLVPPPFYANGVPAEYGFAGMQLHVSDGLPLRAYRAPGLSYEDSLDRYPSLTTALSEAELDEARTPEAAEAYGTHYSTAVGAATAEHPALSYSLTDMPANYNDLSGEEDSTPLFGVEGATGLDYVLGRCAYDTWDGPREEMPTNGSGWTDFGHFLGPDIA